MNLDVEKIIREYIDKSIHMSLATVSGNKPWTCDVHFVYDDNLNLYWRSLPSRRHSQEIEANPNVAGSIVRQHLVEDFPTGLFFEGTAELMTDPSAIQEILPAFIQRVGADASAADEAQRPEGHKFYKATVENWYAFGKFDGDKGLKYKLEWNGGKK